MDRFKDYGALFSQLFTPKTTGDKILLRIGVVSGILLGLSPLVEFTQKWNSLVFKSLVSAIIISVLLFFISFTLLAIRQVGREAGKSNYLSQSLYFFKNLFIFIFLPCIIITALILLWAYFSKQPIFQ